jgi:hypothetical protein
MKVRENPLAGPVFGVADAAVGFTAEAAATLAAFGLVADVELVLILVLLFREEVKTDDKDSWWQID